MLNQVERKQIVEALTLWSQTVPNEPMLGFLEGDQYLTPREIVAAVQQNTQDGQAVLEMLEHGVRREGLEAVVARLCRRLQATARW